MTLRFQTNRLLNLIILAVTLAGKVAVQSKRMQLPQVYLSPP